MFLDKCLCVGFLDQMCYHIMLLSYLNIIIHIIELLVLLFIFIYPNKIICIRIRISIRVRIRIRIRIHRLISSLHIWGTICYIYICCTIYSCRSPNPGARVSPHKAFPVSGVRHEG